MSHWLPPLFYLVLGLTLCWVGKTAYGLIHPNVQVDRELTGKDNLAFALALGGYFLAILIALGAALSGPPRGFSWRDAASSAAWGLGAVVLLNAGAQLTRRGLFPGLSVHGEIVSRGNVSVGILAAASYVANGLVILGALSGPGSALSGLFFWAYGLLWLALSVHALPWLLRYELSSQLTRDNRAVAVSAAGALLGIGNILRLSMSGPAPDMSAGVAAMTGYAAVGIGALLVSCQLFDGLLLPGVTVREEILQQAMPNVGVGFIMGLFYLGASILVGWCL